MGGVKALVFGKGGSGKSTIVALLARALAGLGATVLVVDADESNMTLNSMLGVERPKVSLTDFLGGRRRVAEALFRGGPPLDLSFAERGLRELPRNCISWSGNVGLLVVGKVEAYEQGCACPMNALAREFLSRLRLGEKEYVLVDTDAGLEHFGRGVEGACDVLLMVVDPTFESVVLAEKALSLARQAGKPLYYVVNKVTEELEQVLTSKLPAQRVVAVVRYEPEWARKSLLGEPLGEPPPSLVSVARFLASSARPAS